MTSARSFETVDETMRSMAEAMELHIMRSIEGTYYCQYYDFDTGNKCFVRINLDEAWFTELHRGKESEQYPLKKLFTKRNYTGPAS